MKPEDVTGINSQGFRVHIDGCTCDYNEVTDYRPVKGTSPLEVECRVTYPIFRSDPDCPIHRE